MRHRGEFVKQIPGDWIACGCPNVHVFRCALHQECVLRPLSDESADLLRRLRPAWQGHVCSGCRSASPPPGPAERVATPQKLILATGLCPGDILTLTAAVESLHLTYPGQYLTDVRTPAPAIWQHNPRITPIADDDPDVRRIDMHYPAISRCNQEPVPFLGGYCEYLGQQLGVPAHAQGQPPLPVPLPGRNVLDRPDPPPLHRRADGPVLAGVCRH